ncbi:MAG: fructose-bisphosphatase class III, partial [Clostridia bacterium]|nr:fructose-bisphosphatase class III [Clostridia bacterium]
TLIYNSYGLAITSHAPFESIGDIIEKNHEMMSQKYIVEEVDRRILIEDTDKGKELSDNVNDLKNLMFLYDCGAIAQKHTN